MNIVATKKQTLLHHKIKHHVRMAVVPHKKNNYRPHLIRSHGLVAVAIAVGVLLGSYNLAVTGNVLGDQATITPAGLLVQTNDARQSDGEAPLQLDDRLTKAAYLKAQDMFAKQYWAHNAPDGTQPWKWLGDVNYQYDEAGENLAKGFVTDTATVAAWLKSPEHRANVLKPTYSQVGFASVNGELQGKPTQLVVALYGKPAEAGTVAGDATERFNEASAPAMSPIARFGYSLQTLSPAILGSIMLIIFTAGVAVAAHMYRKKLPKPLRQSWYRHHGLYKAIGLTSFALIIVSLYTGGQI